MTPKPHLHTHAFFLQMRTVETSLTRLSCQKSTVSGYAQRGTRIGQWDVGASADRDDVICARFPTDSWPVGCESVSEMLTCESLCLEL
jgi:hypothetical protein